jgi:hypothetical protein
MDSLPDSATMAEWRLLLRQLPPGLLDSGLNILLINPIGQARHVIDDFNRWTAEHDVCRRAEFLISQRRCFDSAVPVAVEGPSDIPVLHSAPVTDELDAMHAWREFLSIQDRGPFFGCCDFFEKHPEEYYQSCHCYDLNWLFREWRSRYKSKGLPFLPPYSDLILGDKRFFGPRSFYICTPYYGRYDPRYAPMLVALLAKGHPAWYQALANSLKCHNCESLPDLALIPVLI